MRRRISNRPYLLDSDDDILQRGKRLRMIMLKFTARTTNPRWETLQRREEGNLSARPEEGHPSKNQCAADAVTAMPISFSLARARRSSSLPG
jgi:hypothetical protein